MQRARRWLGMAVGVAAVLLAAQPSRVLGATALTLRAFENPGSCPWVFTWDGTQYIKDNDVYSTARGASGEFCDFYTLSQPLVPLAGEYRLLLRETDTEESFTDLVQLLTVDHPAGVRVAADDRGSVLTFVSPQAPLAATDGGGNDVLAQVATADGDGARAHHRSVLTLDFSHLDITKGATLVLRMKGFVHDESGPGDPTFARPAIAVQTLDAAGQWVTRNAFNPRVEFATVAADLTSLLAVRQEVRLLMTSCHTGVCELIDYAALDTSAQVPLTVNALAPLSASHSADGDVRAALSSSDGVYVHTVAGEEAALVFPAPAPAGEERSFVFVAEGYYIPKGTYHIYTWDGSNWVRRYSQNFTYSYTNSSFDLSAWLPDATGLYRARIQRTKGYWPASTCGIDYAGLTSGGTAFLIGSAVDLTTGVDVGARLASAGDGLDYTWVAADRTIEVTWHAANQPPVADAGGPYVVSEGNALTLDASGSRDAEGDPLSYLWDVDGDGDFSEGITGVNPTVPWAVLSALGIGDGPTARTIAVKVSDPYGAGTDSGALALGNVPPEVTPGPPQTADEGIGRALLLGSFADAGDDDPWGVSIAWGDGAAETFTQGSPGSLGTRSHVYADGGVYTVTVTVTEKNGSGASGSGSFPVQVNEATIVATGGLALSALEGEELAEATVATFSDPTGPDDLSRYSGIIDWGDGRQSAASVVPASGGGGQTRAADVLFLVDTTGSMAGYISQLRTALSGILTAIQTRLPSVDIRYAVADYRNYKDGGNYTAYGVNLRQSFTANASQVQSAINSLSAGGGYDLPESQLKAMVTIAQNWLTPAPGAVGFGGRSVSQKLIVWGGDAPGHVAGDENADGPANYYPTLAGTVAALNAAGIQVIGLDTTGRYAGIDQYYGGQYQETYIATETGGTALYSVGAGGQTVQDAVVNSIVGEIESTFLVQGSHVYADNGTYSVQVTLRHDDRPDVIVTSAATVGNVSPGLSLGPSRTAGEGEVVALGPAAFTDPGFDCPAAGTREDFTATVAWGDGTPPATALVEEISGGPGMPTRGTLAASHVYADEGRYQVAVRLWDDDGGWVQSFFDVYVDNLPPLIDPIPDLTVGEGAEASLPPASFSDPGVLDTHTATIDWGDGSTEAAGAVSEAGGRGTVAGSHAYADEGTYQVRLTVFDNDGGSAESFFDIVVVNVPPTVTADLASQSVQYSDSIRTVTFTASDPSPLDTLNAEVFFSANGGPFESGLPDALSIAGELAFAGEADQLSPATWTVSGIADLVPGTYIIRVAVVDGDGGTGFADTTLVVLPEDARVSYAGSLFVSTDPQSPDNALVELRAVVQDICVAGDPESAPDLEPGHITMATVTFVDRIAGSVIAADVPVSLLDSDIGTGVAVCRWAPPPLNSNETAVSYTLGIIVNYCYTRDSSADDVLLTIARPTGQFVTGGGYLVNQYSAGLCAGLAGERTNFGFNVKFNRRMTNLQGHFNAILRLDDGVVLQIRSTALQSLTIDPTRGWDGAATFVSKAVLTDVTDPAAPQELRGNLTLIVSLTDNGEPGAMDTIGITLWDGPQLLFSSCWGGRKTAEQLVEGGNLAVH